MKTLLVKTVLIPTICLVIGINAFAQEMKTEVPDAVKYLGKFAGSWESNVTMTMNGKEYPGIYTVNCKMTADGSGLYADEFFSNPELGTMKGSDLAGFDPFESKIKWFTVDNMGTTHVHTGEWTSPDHLFIEHNGTRDGKKYVETLDFKFKNDNELDFRLVGTLDGVESESSAGTFHKKVGMSVK